MSCGTSKCTTIWYSPICFSKLAIIASDKGLSPGRRQAIIETNDGILLIWSLGTNFSEILIKIHSFSFKKMHLKMSSGKWRPFCLGLNVLTPRPPVLPHVSDKTSYHKKLWSLEDMRLVTCIINSSHNCRGACPISERSHNSKYKSRGFEKFARSYNKTTSQMFQYPISLICKF